MDIKQYDGRTLKDARVSVSSNNTFVFSYEGILGRIEEDHTAQSLKNRIGDEAFSLMTGLIKFSINQ